MNNSRCNELHFESAIKPNKTRPDSWQGVMAQLMVGAPNSCFDITNRSIEPFEHFQLRILPRYEAPFSTEGPRIVSN
jgi:hypothetical protein